MFTASSSKSKNYKVTSPLYPLMKGSYKGEEVAASTLKYIGEYMGEHNNNPRTPPDSKGFTSQAPLYKCEGQLAFDVPSNIKEKRIYLAVFNNDFSTMMVLSVNGQY